MASLAYLTYFAIYQLGVFVCALIVLLVFGELRKLLEGSPVEKYVGAAMVGVFLCVLAGGTWLSHEAARRTVRDGEHPVTAWLGTLDDFRLLVSSVPWIGRMLRPRPKRSRFDPPDDARLS